MKAMKRVRKKLSDGVQIAAALCTKKGWQPVPIPPGLKGPRTSGWQRQRLGLSDVATAVPAGSNLGIHTGNASSGLIDVDLDTRLAVKLAPRILPATGMRHGRPGNRDSHWWYQLDGWEPKAGTPLGIETFTNPLSKAMIVELRGNLHQTLIPPSFNDEIVEGGKKKPGERLAWEKPRGRPAVKPITVLQRSVRELSAITLLIPYWKAGSRNDASLALAGWFLRGGLSEERAARLLGAMAYAVRADEKKVRAVVRDTAAKLKAGQKITGARTLIETFGFPREIVQRVTEWLGLQGISAGSDPSREAAWPSPLSTDAFTGIAGEVVDMIRPHTEADDAALLIHLLAMFGNAVGRKPFAKADGAEHHANIFAMFVGDTASGRKGTAAAQIKAFMKEADPLWSNKSIANGLSSGEGLIWSVRDPIFKTEAVKAKGLPVSYGLVMTDAGVEDKRLLILETEFAQTLRVMRRDSNILSTTIRSAWDSGTLQTLTKNSPAKSTAAHISIIGHITKFELRRALAAVDASNGFANRFLWLAVKRSKLLPHGGSLGLTEVLPLARRLAEVLTKASAIDRVEFGKKARTLWSDVYPTLASSSPTLIGVVTSRAEPQVLRLALLYALLDSSRLISEKHLRAALAVWKYCSESARYIFGDVTGDKTADRILQAAESFPSGISRTEISGLFAGHRPAAELDNAIDLLVKTGKARIEKTATGGRDQERVMAL